MSAEVSVIPLAGAVMRALTARSASVVGRMVRPQGRYGAMLRQLAGVGVERHDAGADQTELDPLPGCRPRAPSPRRCAAGSAAWRPGCPGALRHSSTTRPALLDRQSQGADQGAGRRTPTHQISDRLGTS